MISPCFCFFLTDECSLFFLSLFLFFFFIFFFSLLHVLQVAVLDGVHLNLNDLVEFEEHCEQGRDMGFDGKTLIHPKQINITNTTYGLDINEIEHAQLILKEYQNAEKDGQGVCIVNGQLIENLHAEGAKRVLHEINILSVETSGKFINCEDGMEIPW